MSPRMTFKTGCPHAECETYISTRRGVVMQTIVCHHPQNDGCLCKLDPAQGDTCVWYNETDAPQELRNTGKEE